MAPASLWEDPVGMHFPPLESPSGSKGTLVSAGNVRKVELAAPNPIKVIVCETAYDAVYRHFLTECFRAEMAASGTAIAAGCLGISGHAVAIEAC